MSQNTNYSMGYCETQPPASIGWVALSSVVVVCRPASVTSPLISTIWCFRAYKPYIFCEDMILATCQCQHIFCCWVEPSLLLSISLVLRWWVVAAHLLRKVKWLTQIVAGFKMLHLIFGFFLCCNITVQLTVNLMILWIYWLWWWFFGITML